MPTVGGLELLYGRTSCTTYAHLREAGTIVDSGIGLVKTPTGVREQP